MHRGEDTAFYLAKGFRVVAVDADANHIDHARVRFAAAIADGRLTVEHCAVTGTEGPLIFHRDLDHDDWSTIIPTVAQRNARRGSRSETVEVPGSRLSSVIRRHGVPYYLKVDIEGADTLGIESLLDLELPPKFLSVEVDLTSLERALAQVELLTSLGYKRMQLVNMLALKSVNLPIPALEGRFVDQRFDGFMSGPFGREVAGQWTSSTAIAKRLPHLVHDSRWWGVDGRYPYPSLVHRAHGRARRALGHSAVSWYDLHARQD